jgi:opacity protein-like surface antigen
MKNFNQFILVLVFAFFPLSLSAQDELDAMLDEAEKAEKKRDYVSATFKATRMINMNTVEMLAKNAAEFRISHRFGRLNQGFYELWGLDQATIRLGLDYGITDWLNVGAGRSSSGKNYDAFLKARLLRQEKGGMPLTVNVFSSIAISAVKPVPNDPTNYFAGRIAYAHQIILGRKFNEYFSMQIVPTLVHRNLVETRKDKNTVAAIGAGGRLKLTKRVALNAEYFYRLKTDKESPTFTDFNNSFSIGFDIETGGHVFQLHFSNSLSMIEKGFVAETQGRWDKGDVFFGFNITREFQFGNKLKKEKTW